MASPDPVPDVGRRLCAARLQRGLSQGTVARRAGIAASYLSRIENGRIQPTFPMVLKILRAMRSGFEEVLGPTPPSGRTLGPCPVSARGQCLLDLIRPDGSEGEESYTPREIRLLRKLAGWLRTAKPDRLRAMEVLLEDLIQGQRKGR